MRFSHAGRLKFFQKEWRGISKNKNILHWIQGYKIPFQEFPKESDQSKNRHQPIKNCEELTDALNQLLELGAIMQCNPLSGQFLSSYFLVKKPNGKNRFILNLKRLNTFIHAPHFKMEDARTMIKLMEENCFMATIDLKDAYFLIPIHDKFRKYLRFQFNDLIYEYTCIPFGISTGPYIFSKLTKPVISILRSQGISCVVYLDDFCILGSSEQQCAVNVKITVKLLLSLGFVINFEKSCLKPSQNCKFLGFVFNSVEMLIKLPLEKRIRIRDFVKLLQHKRSIKIREFAKFIGLLISVCPAMKYGWLYTKVFEREKCLALMKSNQNYDAIMGLPSHLKNDLCWWQEKIMVACNNVIKDVYSLEIFTDSSLTGWGVYCEGGRAHGWWSKQDKDNHINYLELLAVFYGLKCFAKHLNSHNILIRVDNTTALSYINRMGSIKYPKLNQLTKQIWQWCESKDLWIRASYIKSENNTDADKESRVLSPDTEWQLAEYAFNNIVEIFGQPKIDLFASNINKKCIKYVSWGRDPDSYAIDAFTITWTDVFFYAFPPFSQILRVLNKIIYDKAEGVIVVPLWEGQPWYPIFLKLLKRKPILFNPSDALLTSPFRDIHPLAKSLTLVAALLSGRLFA